MKTQWCLIAVAVLSLLLPRAAEASSCTAARFHFINNMGCDQRNGGAGGVPKAQCPVCPGMPQWWVSEPYVNLEISDTPLSYRMSSGKEMSFQWHYHQGYKLPRMDEIPNWYYGALPTARSDYYAAARTSGMTNAAWANNWMVNIVFWDASWENAWTYTGSYNPPNYPAYSGGYEALLFRPEGGMNYFNATSSGASLIDPQSQMRLQPISSYPIATNRPTPDANGIYWGDANMGFKLVYPDGSQDIFGLAVGVGPAVPNNFGGGGISTSQALLTQRIDPQGRVTRVGYQYAINTNYNATVTFFGYRVRHVVDPDGRTNTFSYATNGSNFFNPPVPNPWTLSEVVNSYGRKTQLGYKQLLNAAKTVDYGILTSMTDAAGLTSSFQYQASVVTNTLYVWSNGVVVPTNIVGLTSGNGWITNLTTPYGSTRFSYFDVPEASLPDAYQQRAIYVSEPEGAQQLYYYLHNGGGLMATTATAPTVPGQADFDDGTTGANHPALDFRNTIHWGRRQCAALSSSVLAALPSNLGNALTNLTAGDFRKGRTRNWLWQADGLSISDFLSSEQDPSPDAAGQVAGLRTWYNYAGKPSPEVAGSNPQVTCIARLLPDGTSQYTTYNYYDATDPYGGGFVSENHSSYSKPGGGVGVLTNSFYYAYGGVDLIAVNNSAGQSWNLGYTNHALTGITNALNQVTTLTWDAGITWNLTGIQFASGESVAMNVNHSGSFVGGVFVPGSKFGFATHPTWSPSGRAFTINTYSAGLPTSITDDRGLSWTNTWDGLNRLTSTAFPDGTSVSNIYSRLDLVASKDRLDHWTYYGFDGLQHLAAVTNANNAVTLLSWCGCGSLTGILDPLNNLTSLAYDNQGNLTDVSFPDSSAISYQYDLASRRISAADGAGRALQFGYNHQGLVTSVAGANGSLRTATYDALNRPVSVTDADGITVTSQYDAINELLKRTWPDGISEGYGYNAAGLIAYTNRNNQVTRYGRDTAGRLTAVTNANQEITRFTFDSLDNVLSLVDGLNHTRTWQYNEFGWVTNKTDGLGRNAFRYLYNVNGWLTNRWTPEKGDTGYAYDNVGNLTAITYPSSSITYAYDALNQLTNMVDAVGSHGFSWTATGELKGEDGAWANDTVSHTYAQGLQTALSLSQPSGTWSQSYGYDAGWRMTSLSSPAGGFLYEFGGPSAASSLLKKISLPNGAYITNSFDGLARLTGTALNNHWGHTLDGYSYGLDALGLKTNLARDFGLTTSSVNVGYDNIAQLTAWNASETNGVPRLNEQLGWAYDAAHNLLRRTNNLLIQTFAADAADELTSVSRAGTFTESGATPAPATSVTVNGNAAQTYGDFTFARTNLTLADGSNSFTNIAQNIYSLKVTNVLTANLPVSVTLGFDNNGNLTNDGLRSFAYDSENQMTNVSVAGQWKSEFVYDGLNRRRISRDYIWSSGFWLLTSETRLVCDGMLPIQERDTNNAVLVTYTRGLDMSGTLAGAGGIGGLLARTDSNGSTFYHADGSGNVTALIDGYENMVARYLYNPFGKLTGMWGILAPANAMRFSSMPDYHGLAGYLGRFYDPNLPGFLNNDPMGEAGGINLRRAMHNNPVNFIDPWGLQVRYVPPPPMRPQIRVYPRGTMPEEELERETRHLMNSGSRAETIGGPPRPMTQLEREQAIRDAVNNHSKMSEQTCPVSYNRPSGFRTGVPDEVWNDAIEAKTGRVRDPLTGRFMSEEDSWQMGHKPGYEFWKHQESAAQRGISRADFLNEHNNPSHYRPELPSSNASHAGEDLTDTYFGP